MSTNRYLLKYYYIGLDKYHGSQRQKEHDSIEDEILDALLDKKYIEDASQARVDFSSRTDKYVSARGASVAFDSLKEPILMEINSALPMEIGFWSWSEIPSNFSARHDALQRHYKYIVSEPYSRLIEQSDLQLNLMVHACELLEGTHDFLNFSKRSKEETRTIRTMDLAMLSITDDYIVFDFKSQGFLRQQIRRMVAKILELGKSELLLKDFKAMFDASEYISYEPADPRGLILWDIYFGENVTFISDKKSLERMKRYFSVQQRKHALKNELFKCLLEDGGHAN